MNCANLWDRLAGTFQLYVENYALSIAKTNINPSYEVDYRLNLSVIEKYVDIDNYWLDHISGCEDINNLPNDLKELVIQFLPRFFKQYPQYKNAECLKIKNMENNNG